MIPGRGPVDDALIVVENGRVVEVGAYRAVKRGFSGPVRDMGEVTLIPGLINAHTHLEISHMRGLTVSGQGYTAWAESLISGPLNRKDEPALVRAVEELKSCGTAIAADVTTGRNPGLVRRVLERADLDYRHFAEFFGYSPVVEDEEHAADTAKRIAQTRDGNRVFAAGHALYSTHPLTLSRVKVWAKNSGLPFALHLAEHQGEVELLATGQGGFADLLRRRVLPEDYRPPGKSPVMYADELGLLDGLTLAVHCVCVDDRDIGVLAERGASVCLCPRSNAHIGVGRAPWEKLAAAGVNLCLATDSLASNTDLDLWNEAREFAAGFRGSLEPGYLAAMLTINPAEALGLGHEYGTISPGGRAVFSQVPKDIERVL